MVGPDKDYHSNVFCFVFQDEENAVLDNQKDRIDVPEGTFLDPFHSYFILVDDGTENKFAADVRIRVFLEEQMISTWKVPNAGNVRK